VSALDPDDELVPLHTDFDVVWRGCDRGQVADYVDRVETELRFLEVDRDAATRRADALAEQLAAARNEINDLGHLAAAAAAHRRELDAQAADQREQVRTDFELAMTARRAETMRELAAERAAAEASAARLVEEARAEAGRLVAEAREEVARLCAQRDLVMESLRAASEAVAEAAPLLEPLPEEQSGTRAA
jgi:cell division septum initiation protein DivIVA